MALLGSEPEAGCGFSEIAIVIVGDALQIVRIGGSVSSVAAAAGDDAGARRTEGQRRARGNVLQTGLGFIFHGP